MLKAPLVAWRHKDLQPLHLATDDVDYWAPDLIYASQAGLQLPPWPHAGWRLAAVELRQGPL